MKRFWTVVGLSLLSIGTWIGKLPLLSALAALAAGTVAVHAIIARKSR